MARALDAARARPACSVAHGRNRGHDARAQLALFREALPDACLLVDALGTWLAARIAAQIDLLEIDYSVLAAQLDDEAAEFVDADAGLAGVRRRRQRTDRLGRGARRRRRRGSFAMPWDEWCNGWRSKRTASTS